jgi:arylsulfatase
MNRRGFLSSVTAGTASAAMASPQQQRSERPDIIFFIMDQLSARWFSGGIVPTPHFDRLRARGVNFTAACVSNPICCASRATLATGLSTRGHGVLQNGYNLDPAIPTFMRALQRGGWRTGAFGKVHFHSQFAGVHPDYRPYGFDEVAHTEDARAGYWLDWVEQTHPRFYDAALATIWGGAIPELQAYGPRKVDLSARIAQVRRGFRWATKDFPHNTPGRYTLPFPREISQTEWITQNAIEFIRNTEASRPIYAHISYVQPHSPFCPPGDCMKNVDESQIPAPDPIEWLNDPASPKCFPRSEGARNVIPADWRTTRHYYMADLTHLDEQLGRVTQALAEAGRLNRAYVILLSDHGELLLDHGFTGKGERHYDACVRVPLVIAGPGLNQNIHRDELVQLEDIFPTVMEAAGLPMPQPRVIGPYLKLPPEGERYPGRSLLPLCRGDRPSHWRESQEIESYNNIDSTTPANWARTVRTPNWRYTIYPGGNGEQLFSLKDDPAEQRNLARDAGYVKVRSEMRDRLLESLMLADYPHTRNNLYGLGVF